MKIRKIQPAFANPDRSLRRKMSAKIAMKTQMARIQKNTSIDQSRKSPRLFIWHQLLRACGRRQVGLIWETQRCLLDRSCRLPAASSPSEYGRVTRALLADSQIVLSDAAADRREGAGRGAALPIERAPALA